MRVVVTGSQGFIGKNLCFFLREKGHEVLEIHRKTLKGNVQSYLAQAEFVFHLAGINRSNNSKEFQEGNVELTQLVINSLTSHNNNVPVVLTSSSQAGNESKYGNTKLAAEKILQDYSKSTGAPSYIFRLPNVFGKWCKPNYNSFVATFCHNVLNDEKIVINDYDAKVNLVYIDDVCEEFAGLLKKNKDSGFLSIPVSYESTVGKVADMIYDFKLSKETLTYDDVGTGFKRALYSTYLSYTQPKNFAYSIPSNIDDRGVFCEMLKTKDSGQFSYFTAGPGITRGGHYHHTKNEKFLVIKGKAEFKFKNISTGEYHCLKVDGKKPELVETVPGWSHDITNIGEDELIVMLWANEIFDKSRPDTFASQLYKES